MHIDVILDNWIYKKKKKKANIKPILQIVFLGGLIHHSLLCLFPHLSPEIEIAINFKRKSILSSWHSVILYHLYLEKNPVIV